MSRIQMIVRNNATAEQAALLDPIEKKLGMVPNLFRLFANSPAAFRAFLGIHAIAAEGLLEPQTRERIALAVAEANSCEYCLSAHTALGRRAGLDGPEMELNRAGASRDEKAAAAIRFARALVDQMGGISAADVAAVRNAGYNDAEIVEIVVHVGLNILTNIMGKASAVAIDFPRVSLDRAS